MAVHVGEIVSNVIPEPEPTSPGGDAPEWQRAAELRQMHARSCRDHWRTAAEGFDD
jgi:hypothetical protein